MLRHKFEFGSFFEPETSLYVDQNGDVVPEGPYTAAILSNDFPKFVSLVESESKTRNWSRDGLLLYYIIICYKRLEMFNYLINLDNFDIDSVDLLGRTLLMNIALRTESSMDQFALALLEKGINFHWADNEGNTYLHAAALNTEHLAVAQLVIEKGADVNAQNNDGVTPLNMACDSGNVDMIHMLLYYGANATIPTNEGLLPVAMYCIYIGQNDEEPALLLEILFNHTFDDDDDITLPVINLAAAMFYNDFYSKISNVTYEISDLEIMCKVIHNCGSTPVGFLFDKFEKVVEDTIKNFPVLDIVTEYEINRSFQSRLLWETLKILLESKHVATLVQNANPTGNIIFKIVKLFDQCDSNWVIRVEEREISKMICLMLSYGLRVTSLDLDTVYHHYGYCELFKILLHMNIKIVSSTWDSLQMRVTRLYCTNPGIHFDDLLAICPPVLLSKFYHHPKLTDIIMKNDYKGAVTRTAMSQVPLLVELSRNVARRYIVNKYSVRSSRQFYTILNWLPVGELNKSILRLEKPLYEGVENQDDTYLLNSWLK